MPNDPAASSGDALVVSENYIGFPAHKMPLLRLPGRFLS